MEGHVQRLCPESEAGVLDGVLARPSGVVVVEHVELHVERSSSSSRAESLRKLVGETEALLRDVWREGSITSAACSRSESSPPPPPRRAPAPAVE